MEDIFKNKCYQNMYLKQVIFRIDFTEQVENEKVFNENLDSVITKYFPIKGKDIVKYYNSVDVNVNPVMGNVSSKANRTEGLARVYLDLSKKNELLIANDSVIFKYENYISFEATSKAINEIVMTLWQKGRLVSKRVGLRYINLYNTNPSERKVSRTWFSNKVKAVMIPSLVDVSPELLPVRNMITTEYVCGDIIVLYRAGIYNKLYPMPISAREDYVIDMDCFSSVGMDSSEDINAFLSNSHGVIQTLFENSINDKMREAIKNDG